MIKPIFEGVGFIANCLEPVIDLGIVMGSVGHTLILGSSRRLMCIKQRKGEGGIESCWWRL